MLTKQYKVIPLSARSEAASWEQSLNEAALDGWELFATPVSGDSVFAIMHKETAVR